jgi:regulator of RNase E activity RraA
VAGLRILPGDLLHGDRHGIVKIPLSIADKLPAVAERLKEREEEIMSFCRSDEFSREKLRQILRKKL